MIFFIKILKNETYLKKMLKLEGQVMMGDEESRRFPSISLKHQTHTNELHHKTNKKEQRVPLRVRRCIREKKTRKKKTEKRGKKRGKRKKEKEKVINFFF